MIDSLLVFGVSHRTAPVELREKIAVGEGLLPTVLARLAGHKEIREVVVLSTCNRVELFVSVKANADQAAAAIRYELASLTGVAEREIQAHAYAHHGVEAVKHLFRVAGSLESMVVGEPQILGQVKSACEMAEAAGTLGGPLARCLHRAAFVAKRVRTETQIGKGSVSISSVAVDLARQIFGDLGGHTVLLVGAGEMAESAAKSLGKGAKPVRICNRSIERAEKLARDFGGVSAPWSALEEELTLADVVVVSTGASAHVITRDMVKRVTRARRGRTLFFIDIAVPRNVDPRIHGEGGVYVYDIDDLSSQVESAKSSRGTEVILAERIVDAEVADFERRSKAETVQPTLVALRAKTKATLNAELERSLSGRLKHLGDGDRAALRQMIESVTNKLLHAPTTRLKAKAGAPGGDEAAALLEQLFDLNADAVRAFGDAEDDADAKGSDPPRGYSH